MLTPIQAVSNDTFLPERLNLAIGKRCFVSCQGCYTHFGQHEPDLKRLLESVSRFVDLGVRDITISGGDPLTMHNLLGFLDDLRQLKVRSINSILSGPISFKTRCVKRYLQDLKAGPP